MFRFHYNKETGECRVYRYANPVHRRRKVTAFDHLVPGPEEDIVELRSCDVDSKRAIIASLAKLMNKVQVRYGERGVTVDDSDLTDRPLSETVLVMEMMRGRNIIPTQVFSGRSRLNMTYTMGFNETPKTTYWVQEFMRAYTHHEFPIWKKADQLALMINDEMKVTLPFKGLNPYVEVLKCSYFDKDGNLCLFKEFDFKKNCENSRKLGDDLRTDFNDTYHADPLSYDMVEAYRNIRDRVLIWRNRSYRIPDNEGFLSEDDVIFNQVVAQVKTPPTLQELCLAKLYEVTMDQTKGSFESRYSLPHMVPAVGYMRYFNREDLAQWVPLLRPDYYFHTGAFKTGASPEGIYKSLSKISQFDRPAISAKPEHVAAAACTMFKLFGFFQRFRVYKNQEEMINTLGAMSVPWNRNAGIHLCSTGEISKHKYNFEGYVVEETKKCTWDVPYKANAMGGVLKMTKDLINFLIERLFEDIPKYGREWFIVTVAKLGNKVEILGPEADREKNRVFFIGCLMKMVLQKLTMSAPFREMFGRSFCGVGMSWSGAGTARVASQLKFDDLGKKARRWFQGDFRALDQSMKAGLMCFICMLMSITLAPGETPTEKTMWRVCIALFAWLADDTAITLIKWFGKEWRYVVGVLFSGEFVTSMFDTIYVYIALMCVHYSFLEDLKVFAGSKYEEYKKEILEAISDFALIYGDDTTWSLPKRVVDLLECIPVVGKGRYLDEVIRRLKEFFDMEMKPKGSSDTDEFNTPYTKCTKDGTVLSEGGKYGLKFLRRHFIWGVFTKTNGKVEHVPVSVRKVSDVWARATNTQHDASVYTQWFPKAKSFLYENMGVSLLTDRFIRYMLCVVLRNSDHLEGKEGEDYIVLSKKFGYSRVKDRNGRAVKFDRGDSEIIDKYKRVAPWMTEEDIFNLEIPARIWLLDKLAYKPDSTYHVTRLFSCRTLREGVFKCDADDLEW